MPVCMLYSVLPPCAPSRAPFQSACRPNASGSRLAALARCGHACRASSGPEQPSGDEVAPSVSDRRGVLLAAAGALSMVAAGPAAAVVEGYNIATSTSSNAFTYWKLVCICSDIRLFRSCFQHTYHHGDAILTLLGGFDPQTQSLRQTDIAHHL